MAGSIKWVKYVSDFVPGAGGGAGGGAGATQVFRALLDESNAEALDFDDVNAAADLALPVWPPGWEMRKVHLFHKTTGASPTTYRRSLAVGKPSSAPYTSGGTVTMQLYPGGGGAGGAGGVTWTITGATGEKHTFPTSDDTGITDGDAT